MYFELNFKSGRPVYQQIIDQVKGAAASGGLRRGEQLPSIRALAERLRINRNTVARAYGELEHGGLVKSEHGRGVFFTAATSPLNARTRRELLGRALDAAIIEAHHFRVADEELLKLLQERLKAFKRRRVEAA